MSSCSSSCAASTCAPTASGSPTLLDSVHLDGFEDRYPYELSGGMQQRAAFCQALVHEPDTLLLDEPLGKLDAMTRERIRQDLQRVWLQRRPTVVFVTHSIEEAVQLSTAGLRHHAAAGPHRPGHLTIDLPFPRDLEVKRSARLRGLSRGDPGDLPWLWRHLRTPRPAAAGLAMRSLGTLGRWLASSWLFLAFFAGFFLFWEFSIDWFEVPRYILPKPSEIVAKSSADLERLLYYTYVTGVETVLGYAVAIVLALPLGLAIAFSSILRRTIYPFFVSIEMVPKIAFAPLFISWLGFGLLPKVIIVFLVCFFPIVLNAILAFGSLGEELTRFCRATGAGPLRTFFKVRLPAAMPQCFVGLQIRRDQRDGGRDDRRVHRQRSGPRLLHPDRDRQHAPGPGVRRHLPAHAAGARAVRAGDPGRAAADPMAHFAKARPMTARKRAG